MASAMSIPIAGFKDVYDVSNVERALQELPASANDALTKSVFGADNGSFTSGTPPKQVARIL